MAAIATVSGTAIRPGISKNNRKYTVEAIGRMVERANQRLAEDEMPLTTLTHHEAGDDSTRIVGRLTRLTQEADGSASYDAEITDTTYGRDILGLVAGPSPALKGVSIRGAWVGPVRREAGPGGVAVETADDLELDGLDYTRKPGVPGAGIASVALAGAEPRESDGTARVPITESAPEASVTITETAATEAGPFADHGYRGEPRFPVGTRIEAKAAWLALAETATARDYTAAQLKRVKQRVGKALRSHGVTVETSEGWLIDPPAPLAECFGYGDDPGHGGSLGVTLSNGPISVTVSSYCVDPHDLSAIGHAAMAGACGALAAIDPDMDADMDVPGAPAEDTDADMDESAPVSPALAMTSAGAPIVPAVAGGITHTSAPETPAAETTTQEKEPAMAESTTPAATTPGTDSGIDALSAKFDKLTDAIAGLVTKMTPAPAVEAAPAVTATVVEAAPVPVTETEEQRIARLVESAVQTRLTEAVQKHVELNGPPTRKGLVTQVNEHTAPAGGTGLNAQGVPSEWPDKPIHTYTDEERAQYFGPAMEDHVFGHRTR